MDKTKLLGRADWMQTYTGKQFFPRAPEADKIDIEDIAHALSNLCRFCGHSQFYYSVAQHSVLVSKIVDKSIALESLMHDAAEAYTGDLIRPIKKSVLDWNELEDDILRAICQKFNLRYDVMRGPDVKRADDILLATEKRDVMGPAPAEWMVLPEPMEARITAMGPTNARLLFLERFRELT